MASAGDFTDDELELPLYLGAILDEDLEKQFDAVGDYALTLKKQAGNAPQQNIMLCVRMKKGTEKDAIYKMAVKKTSTGCKIIGKDFKDIMTGIEWFKKEPRKVPVGTLTLKRPILRGKWSIRHKDILWLKRIGSGAYGQVFRCKLFPSGQTCAAKRLDQGTTQDELVEMMKEARVMQIYDHLNVVKFFGCAVDKPPFILVMEYCNGGSVEDKLRKHGKDAIPVKKRINWSAQAAAGIEYLHSKNCIHRDIAARNCLVASEIIKIADFGMCRPSSVYKVNLAKPQNVRWLAPEVWRTGETNFRTDVYAFAVLMWELFVIPYDSPYKEWKAIMVKKKVMEGYRMPPPEAMPLNVREVLAKCWAVVPAERLSMAETRVLLASYEKTAESASSETGSAEPDKKT